MATTNPVTLTRRTTSTRGNWHNRNPSISADGTKVAFVGPHDFFNDTLSDGIDLWMVDTATKELQRLVKPVPARRFIAEPDVNADGPRVLFRSNADLFNTGIPGTSADIWLYDTVAKTLTQVTNGRINGRNSLYPSISADGTKIVFESNADILNEGSAAGHLWLYDTAIQTYTRVTDYANWPANVNLIRDPEITLDGTAILFASSYDHFQDKITSPALQEIWHYNIATGIFTRVTDSKGLPFTGLVQNNLAPGPNGNGTVVAFQSNVDFLEEGNIGVYEIWQAVMTPTTPTTPRQPIIAQVFLPLVMRSGGSLMPVIWEGDDFDSLVPGPLDGQNGWSREVDTIHSSDWDKKFQLYFGSRSMRFNNGPTLYDAVPIVPRTQLGHRYTIHVNLDMNTELADVVVDGVVVAHDVPMHSGLIVSLGLSGWDLPGDVQVDDLRGVRQ